MYNKYHNKKLIIDGLKFDSDGEYQYWLKLSEMQEKGEIKGLQRQVRIEILPKQLYPNGKVKHRAVHYVADFVYEDKDGDTHYVDFKGIETAEFKIKQKLFSYYVGKDIELVKMKKDKKNIEFISTF